MQQFNELKLQQPIFKALQSMQFEKPTPIQAQAIPLALEGKDIIACAQTGTGKTAAFCLPIVDRLLAHPQKMALILVPTRELAAQVTEVLKDLTRFTPGIKGALLIGGMSMRPQMDKLKRGVRLVVATPGRLLDHLERRTLDFKALDILVLDEADRMLDMGFAPQLNKILPYLPKGRQTLLFSATLPANIEQLSARYLTDPVRVTVGSVSRPVEKIQQSIVETTAAGKNETLVDELLARKGSVLIFARTKARTDRVAQHLQKYGHSVTRLHGDRTQGQRNSAVAGFRDGRFRILVATDIAARGIDISHIANVINYDLPHVPEDYVHRIGRTARAGAEGQAVSFVTPEDKALWRAISNFLGKTGAPSVAFMNDKGRPAKKIEKNSRSFRKKFSGKPRRPSQRKGFASRPSN
ncbi:MAG: DEAD/DEAH box helicase [Nitrospinota bacterium]|nr:DEAD/DEAH box helicase [Nitrospinota bacterium]